MPRYFKTYVDISKRWEDDIDTVSYIVEAANAEDARDKALERVKQSYPRKEYYVWSVDPDDEVFGPDIEAEL